MLRGGAVALDPAVRAVVLTGAGPAFCAGGDLKSVVAMAGDDPRSALYPLAAIFHQAVIEIRRMRKPVIAALNGPAAGGGFSLALACDLRIMAAEAFMQQAYTASGLVMDGGGSWSLPRLVGTAKALEIVMLDPRIPAADALRIGLVTKVVPATEVASAAAAMAEQLALKATGAIGETKRLLLRSLETSLETQLEAEREAIAEAASGAEGREGLAAFVGKRKPDFVLAG